MIKLKQKAHQSVQDYIHEFEKLKMKTNTNEEKELVIAKFLKGLNSKIFQKI